MADFASPGAGRSMVAAAGRLPDAVERSRRVRRMLVGHNLAYGSRGRQSCAALTGSLPTTGRGRLGDRKSTRLNSSHANISYAVFCLKKKKKKSQYSHSSPAQIT